MKQAIQSTVLVVGVAGLFGCSTAEVEAPHPFLGLLPQAGDAGSWKPEDEPQHVEGEDLFLLINGGAEIYHEYGFTQAAVQSYIDDQDRCPVWPLFPQNLAQWIPNCRLASLVLAISRS